MIRQDLTVVSRRRGCSKFAALIVPAVFSCEALGCGTLHSMRAGLGVLPSKRKLLKTTPAKL